MGIAIVGWKFKITKMDIINPGNLRWFYMLDALIEDENDAELIQRFKRCQDTLHKFPLYMEKPEQCGLLQNFNTVVIQKMCARFEQEKNFFNDSMGQEARQPLGNLSENQQKSNGNGSVISNSLADQIFGEENEFSFESKEPEQEMVPQSTDLVSGSSRKKMCKYGKDCYQRNTWHLQEFYHPGEGDHADPKYDEEGDDIKKIIDEAKQREIQEAEDLKMAMQLSQEMNEDNGLEEGFEDEFDQFINKPSAAFQLENSKSQIFDNGDISQNEGYQSVVQAGPSTQNVQKNSLRIIPEAMPTSANAYSKNTVSEFGGFSNSSDDEEMQSSQFSQKSKQVRMVGKLENVKENDQYAKDLELAMQLSQQYNQPNVSNEKVKNDQQNKTKKKLFGSDPIFQRLANSSDDEETEMNLNPPVNKKSKKMPSKGKVKNNIFDNDPIFKRLAELEDNEDEAEQQRNAKKKTKRKTQPSATITSSSSTQPNTSQQIDEDTSENELRTPKKRSTSQSPGSSQKKSGS